MLEILQKFVTVLKNDATLTAIVPANNIMVGPVDIVMEKQAELLYPSINLSIISEVQRSIPTGARDTQVSIDIWSRNSQLEAENIYERVIALLQYMIADQGSAHIFWDRLGGAVDLFETDRRVWHKATTFTTWSMK